MKKIETDKKSHDVINGYCDAIRSIREGRFDFTLPAVDDEISRLGDALDQLRFALEKRSRETRALAQVRDRINAGLTIDEILNFCYESFSEIMPYNRIGFALVEENGESVRAVWAMSDAQKIILEKDYVAPLLGSSLEQVMNTGNPRILNDLESYLLQHPQSVSTRKIVEEGMRSSLTCPLLIKGKPVGFLFFSSKNANTYQNIHIDIFREIAEQVALILEKGRLYQRLQELNELKNTLLGVAAHDLRSPIGVIRGFSELMMDGMFGPVNDQQKKYLQKIEINCDAMLNLINNLLEISSIESGKLELSMKEVNPASYLREFHEYGSVMARKKGMELILDLPPELPKAIFDPERVNQALDNLVSNAVKYSFPESKITIMARINEGNDLEISVQDQGQGIREDEIPLLFKDYQKAGSRPTGGEKSSGLGLAIVRRIVKAHEGSFRLQSKLGQGSVFTITLPLKGPQNLKPDFREL